jgi:hypothetical protein
VPAAISVAKARHGTGVARSDAGSLQKRCTLAKLQLWRGAAAPHKKIIPPLDHGSAAALGLSIGPTLVSCVSVTARCLSTTDYCTFHLDDALFAGFGAAIKLSRPSIRFSRSFLAN